MTTTEYPHDPEFPYLLVHETAGVLAKFKEQRFALDRSEDIAFAEDYSVIDTTPKPRIPVDARYLAWWGGGSGGNTKIAHWEGTGHDGTSLWRYMGTRFTEKQLLGLIDDAKITVLDPREGRK